MVKPKIIWTEGAKLQLKEIYFFYKSISLKVATNIKTKILNAPKSIIFDQQFQIDEIEPSYRRIIVDHYKLI